MTRYRVNGLATVHVHVDVEASSEAEALRKARDVAPLDWTEEGCGVPVDVEVGDVRHMRAQLLEGS